MKRKTNEPLFVKVHEDFHQRNAEAFDLVLRRNKDESAAYDKLQNAVESGKLPAIKKALAVHGLYRIAAAGAAMDERATARSKHSVDKWNDEVVIDDARESLARTARNVVDRLIKKLEGKLSDSDCRLLALLLATDDTGKPLSFREIGARLGISAQSVSRHRRRLANSPEAGVILKQLAPGGRKPRGATVTKRKHFTRKA